MPTSFEPTSDARLEYLLADEGGRAWFAALGFANAEHAQQRMAAVARALPEAEGAQAFMRGLVSALSHAAHPERVLTQIERFLDRLEDEPGLLHASTADPRHAEMLVALFAGSAFLAEILLAHPAYFVELTQAQADTRARARLEYQPGAAELYAAAREAIADVEGFAERADTLRRFQRREMLRIGANDLLGLWGLGVVTEQLSFLAESLVRAALEVASEATGTVPAGFAVLAMGKLGGQELNYSSDIDLLFLAASQPASYTRLALKLMDTLRSSTAEGFLYRVDMRLRPWGRVGPLVSSPGGFLTYLRQNARLWEKQALLKARFIAGNEVVARSFLDEIQPLLFSTDAAAVRADVHDMKQRIEAQLHKSGRDWGEVKLGKGSIRDVEFVTQYLQLVHGAEHPRVRSPQTLDALARLADAGLLPVGPYRILVDGYTFLRTVEHHLQLMHYRQMHTLPEDPKELFHLARRLQFGGPDADADFLAQYERHAAAIRDVYRRYLFAETDPGAAEPAAGATNEDGEAIRPHLRRLSPAYAVTFGDRAIERHAALARGIDADHPIRVEPEHLEGPFWRITIVGFDNLGALSVICGLLFAYRFSILDGHVFTYAPAEPEPEPTPAPRRRRARSAARRTGRRLGRAFSAPTPDPALRPKLVDVLTVRALDEPGDEPTDDARWATYAEELSDLMRLLEAGRYAEAQGRLARRVALAVERTAVDALSPVKITVDNTASDRHTVLRIDAPDTPGFLYEFTNALALHRIHIDRVHVSSDADRVQDTLYVADHRGRKITDPDQQRRLRAAVVLVKQFTHLLPSAPDPESALLHFRSFLATLFQRDDWPDEIATLERPEVLDALTRLLGVSDFLWEDFLRLQHENLFPIVRDTDALAEVKTRAQLQAELDARLAEADTPEARRDALNEYKDREMFRIDMRYILGQADLFDEFSEELSDLAEVVVATTLRFCADELAERHGRPRLESGEPCAVSVCALGKCGGRELGFASDIELLFVYEGRGRTDGDDPLSNAEFFNRVVRSVSEAIRAKREGIFEIDLRLRPYGRAGNLAVSIQSFRRYFAPDGPAWSYERQLLVKLRPIAGDAGLGAHLQHLRDELLQELGRFDTAAMRAMRERQQRHLVQPGTINAKYSPGGLVDVEYLVQGLQISYCRRYPDLLRHTSTRDALRTLGEVGLLSEDDRTELERALGFLRRLIEALRMVHGNAKDLTVPPADSPDFAFLARRLGSGDNPEALRRDLTRHMETARKLSAKLLG